MRSEEWEAPGDETRAGLVMQAAGEAEAMSGYPAPGAWPASTPGSQAGDSTISGHHHHFPSLSTPVKQMEGECQQLTSWTIHFGFAWFMVFCKL